jgi:hypothetical protein
VPRREDNSVMLEDVRIIFKNFSGKPGQYNADGNRNFAVLLDQEQGARLYDEGWNVKVLKSREADEPEQPYLPVKVSYKGRPPRIVMITSRGRTTLDEDTCQLVDWADIRTVDLIFRAYDWEVNGKTGRTAYLQSIFVIIEEDALDLKYSDVRDAQSPHEPDEPGE